MEHNGKEPKEYLYKTMEIQKSGATFLVNLYLPTTGTGSLRSRLLRLMEQDLERQEQGKGCCPSLFPCYVV